MSTTRELLNNVVDYIELTQSVIAGLQKKASETKPVPAFRDEDLKKTAEVLVGADLLSPDKTGQLVESYKANPARVLESLQKLASLRQKTASVSGMVGSPVESTGGLPAQGAQGDRESDKAFLRHFKLN